MLTDMQSIWMENERRRQNRIQQPATVADEAGACQDLVLSKAEISVYFVCFSSSVSFPLLSSMLFQWNRVDVTSDTLFPCPSFEHAKD